MKMVRYCVQIGSTMWKIFQLNYIKLENIKNILLLPWAVSTKEILNKMWGTNLCEGNYIIATINQMYFVSFIGLEKNTDITPEY